MGSCPSPIIIIQSAHQNARKSEYLLVLGVWGGAAPGPRSTGSYLWGTTLLILRTGSGSVRVGGVVPGMMPSDIHPWGTSSPAIITINSVPQNTAAWSSSLLALGGGRDMILGLATNARPGAPLPPPPQLFMQHPRRRCAPGHSTRRQQR